jgi:hypothetical protein
MEFKESFHLRETKSLLTIQLWFNKNQLIVEMAQVDQLLLLGKEEELCNKMKQKTTQIQLHR